MVSVWRASSLRLAAVSMTVAIVAKAAGALVVGLGPALLLRFALRAIGLAGLGGGRTEELEAPFGGWVRRLIARSNSVMRACDCLLLEEGGLLLENDLDQFGLGKLLQLLACHGRAPCCHGECVWAAW